MFFLFPGALQAQKKYAKLKEIYDRFILDRAKIDSALLYAGKVKEAAVIEFGDTSAQYFWSLNAMGVVYNRKKQNNIALSWYRKASDEFAKVDAKKHQEIKSFVYWNIKFIYLNRLPNIDSAIFFTDQYISVERDLLRDKPYTSLNLVDTAANEFESAFGIEKANRYYNMALDMKVRLFGKWSKVIIKGIDSIIRRDTSISNPAWRMFIYKVNEQPLPVKELDSLLQTGPVNNDFGKTFSYASSLMDGSLKQYGDTSLLFFKGLKYLGLAYHNWLREDSIALFFFKSAMAILKSQKRENSILYAEFAAAMDTVEAKTNIWATTIAIERHGPKGRNFAKTDTVGQLTRPGLMLPISHAEAVFDARFSPDNNYVISRSYNDNNAKVWKVKTGELIYNLSMESMISQALFTPDGTGVLTTSNNKAAIWDLATGKKRAGFENTNSKTWFANYFTKVTFFESKKYIVTARNTAQLSFWDLRTGDFIKQITFKDTIADIVKTGNDSTLLIITQKDDRKNVLLLRSVIKYNIVTDKADLLISEKTFDYVPGENSIALLFKDYAALHDLRTWKTRSIIEIKPKKAKIVSLSANGNKLLLSYVDRTTIAYITKTGAIASSISLRAIARNVEFFGNGEKYILRAGGGVYSINTDDGRTNNFLSPDGRFNAFINFSSDKKYVLMVFDDNVIRMWDVSGKVPVLEQQFSGKTQRLVYDALSKSSGHIAIANDFGKIKVFNLHTGVVELTINASERPVNGLKFSQDSKYLIATSGDSTGRVWAIPSGKLLMTLKHPYGVYSTDITSDNKFILTNGSKLYRGQDVVAPDTSITSIWNWESGLLFKSIESNPLHKDGNFNTIFSNDNKSLITINGGDSIVSVTKIETKKQEQVFKLAGWFFSARESKNGQFIIAMGSDSVTVFDKKTGRLLHSFPVENSTNAGGWDITLNGDFIISGSYNGLIDKWEVNTGKLVQSVKGHSAGAKPLILPGDSVFVTPSEDGTIKVWRFKDMQLLYQIVPIGNTDYLVTDPYGRYDGTEAARKLLYFTCGTEVIGLDQVKDQLWVPNLAERIMKGDSINAKKLSDLDICGLVPEVEKEEKTGYHFNITPRRGGLGETVLLVNDIEVKRYQPNQLAKTATGYELNVGEQELQTYFIAGKLNPVTVKAYTAKNDIASRGVQVMQDETKKQAAAPNLYAVMIGISDYKGTELQLKYAAKDATDISAAISSSAGKLLGKGHVFTYNLTTSANHYQLPEKIAIKNVFGEIGKKATANDILLVFFAGHGVTSGEKKQFYFLTADASQASAIDAPDQVGISTKELSEWMQPTNIKAQKRILILDACNSGQAINEIVKIGNADQNYLAARNDDKAEQIKAIDKLNEKSGLFILAASASNQSAYEMGRYSQGLLTYSLLKAIKQQPDILEDGKYLNVSRWFNAAEKTVSDMVRETGNRQEPQIVSAGNFNIGLVDPEVMDGIKLAEEKPLFTASKFLNVASYDDNLDFSSLIDQSMNEISSRGGDSEISYVSASASTDAWSLSGGYDVKGDEITVKVNITQNKEIKNKLELTGKKSELKELAKKVVNEATGWILKKK